MAKRAAGLTRRAALALPAAALLLRPARAQAPIRIISGFAAGGSQDVLARILAEEFQQALGVGVVVENRTGAAGTIAGEVVKGAAPDGTTLLIANIVTMSLAPFSFSGLRYDSVKDFAALAKTTEFPIVLGTGAMTGAATLAELLAWARAHPDRCNMGVPATGSLPHLFAARLAQSTGLNLTVVPYRGGAPIAQDLIGGQLAMGFGAAADFSELHQAKKLIIVAASGTARHPSLADVPTFAESGVSGLDSNGWNGLFLPAGTPPALVERYHRIVAAALDKPAVRERLIRLGFLVTPSTPQALAGQMAEEMRLWGPTMTELMKPR
jgi:tripartite-type tricarboxylate transporter receptor subunit TctC